MMILGITNETEYIINTNAARFIGWLTMENSRKPLEEERFCSDNDVPHVLTWDGVREFAIPEKGIYWFLIKARLWTLSEFTAYEKNNDHEFDEEEEWKRDTFNRLGISIQILEVAKDRIHVTCQQRGDYSMINKFMSNLNSRISEILPLVNQSHETSTQNHLADVQEGEAELEPLHPYWWPKQKAKILRWKLRYKKILPLYEKGLNFKEIARRTGFRRQEISQILQWAKMDPRAH